MCDTTEKYSIAITIERGGDVWEAKASTVWKEEEGKADGPWCFAMTITNVLETLRNQMSPEEWSGFVRGVQSISEEYA